MAEHFYVYGRTDCTFCKMTETLLAECDKSYTYFNLGEHFTRDELLEKFPDAKTYPQIVVHNSGHETYIGGFTQLEEYIDGQ